MASFLAEYQQTAAAITQFIALTIDLIALFIIGSAAIRALITYVLRTFTHLTAGVMARIRQELGHALVLALEFLIGADILRTAIAPTWTSIGQLGAIILLRTLLDFFLERELLRPNPGDAPDFGEKRDR